MDAICEMGPDGDGSNVSRSPLRIHIVTEEDPFYLPVFFREFFTHLPRDRFIVTGVDITPPLNQKTRLALARKLYSFYGPLDFARLVLRYAAVTALDLLSPRLQWSGTVPRIVASHGIPCRVVPHVNAPEYVEQLRRLDLDLLVSVAASQIFKQQLLSVPRLDAINIHTGTLPNYRGMMPVFWQMYDRRASIGITIHTMTTDIDLGQVLLHREVPLEGDRKLDTVVRKMKRHGAQAMLEVLERYHADSVKPLAMNRSGEGYRSFPGRNEAVAFRKMGYRLL
jgi:methionyl-tRNA formyltransferase